MGLYLSVGMVTLARARVDAATLTNFGELSGRVELSSAGFARQPAVSTVRWRLVAEQVRDEKDSSKMMALAVELDSSVGK
jgi:hypothetical protein